MADKKKGKEKYPLLFATIVSLLTVCTCGVSTFAWFQASASVNIQSTSTDATITVNKPESYSFLAYRGNYEQSAWANKGTFAGDFVTITDSNKDLYASFTGSTNHGSRMNPGDVKCFGLSFTNHTSGQAVQLSIHKLISKTIYDINPAKHRYIHGGSVEIDIGWAMNIYTHYVAGSTISTETYNGFKYFATSQLGKTSAEGSNGVDKFVYTSAVNPIGGLNETQSAVDNHNKSSGEYTLDSLGNDARVPDDIQVFNETKTDPAGFLFFSIVFSNQLSDLYKETDGSTLTPLLKPSTNNTRYFVQNTSDASTTYNSNCFAEMEFAITNMIFEW